MKKFLLASVAFVGLAGIANAAGFLTNGLPTVGAPTVNGAGVSPPSGIVTELGAGMTVPVDTNLANGQPPQSVSATIFQIAAVQSEIAANTATSTAGAATLNTLGGTITTESLSTAAGGTYSFVLTDSQLAATSTPQFAMYAKTNTGGSRPQIVSVTSASGSATVVFSNQGTTAWNGTMVIAFHL